MKLNNKGFTLIEILAVIVIISVLGGIAVVGVMSSINSSKEASYKVMLGGIVSACNNLYEEVSNSKFMGVKLYHYSIDGDNCSLDFGCKTSDEILIASGEISVNLQTLVSNGFLDGVNNDCMNKCNSKVGSDKEACVSECSNKNYKIIIDPKTKEDIGACLVSVKMVNNKISVSGSSVSGSSVSGCPNDFSGV